MNTIIEFANNNWLEAAGVTFSLAYLYFSINRKLWLWVVGIISSSIYIMIFFKASLYANMIQNVYYVIISIYGFIIWVKDKDNFDKATYKVEVYSTPLRKIKPIILVWLLIYAVVYCFTEFVPGVVGINEATVPLVDSCLTSMAVVATWMLAKKYIEQWFAWLFIDLVYIAVYAYKDLYLTCLLFLIYTFMSIVGYLKWKEHLITHSNNIT